MLTFIKSLGDFVEPSEVIAVKIAMTSTQTKEVVICLKTFLLRHPWVDTASFQLIGEEIRAAQALEFQLQVDRSLALQKAMFES
jgi:hypothetical protein